MKVLLKEAPVMEKVIGKSVVDFFIFYHQLIIFIATTRFFLNVIKFTTRTQSAIPSKMCFSYFYVLIVNQDLGIFEI